MWITLLNVMKKVNNYTTLSLSTQLQDTVTKCLNGSYKLLCRKNFCSGMDQFYNYIIKELSAGRSRKGVYRSLFTKSYQGL